MTKLSLLIFSYIIDLTRKEIFMSYPMINNCPVCTQTLQIKKLECLHCHTVIENNFTLSKLAMLSTEQMKFVEVFIVNRGNIKEVEKELGISYPTVRGKLQEVIALFTSDKRTEDQSKMSKSEIITLLEEDQITSEEAIKLLKKIRED